MNTSYSTSIIGAGPAGMMAAIMASRNHSRVALIDRNPQLGRKLLATGNGRCNLTNSDLSIDHFHGADPEFIAAVLRRFDQRATMDFFEGLGLLLKEEDNGRIFPRTNQASSVVEVLRQALADGGVDIMLDSLVVSIERANKWTISLNNGATVQSDKLIIATGGKAAHQFGSTGDGYRWAKKLGHTITPFHAALAPVETVEQWPRECQGTKVDARVWATCGCEATSETTGDVLFTDYGLSGPAVMSQARAIATLPQNAQVKIHIDMFPDMTEEQLAAAVGRTTKTASDALVGLLPSGLIPVVIRQTGQPDSAVAIARTLKNLTLMVAKLRPYKEAQVTAGGVATSEVDPETLQSRLVPGLYFAGEVLDVDGDSGGYNLQWAWASGYVAGMGCSQ